MAWGFGIPATGDESRASRIAREIEHLGFDTIWTNDIPRADGIRTAAYFAESTSEVRLGVGVVPCDRRPPEEIASRVGEVDLPLDRLVLGIGAGSSTHPVQTVRACVHRLKELLGPSLEVGVAAMGGRMCALAGEVADLVLLNWMVPDRTRWARGEIDKGRASRRDSVAPEVAGYVRVALAEDGRQRIRAEAERYYAMPAYRRHFEAMGEDLSEVGVAGPAAKLVPLLAGYEEVLDEVVIRALPASDSIESTLAVAEATAPAR
ncbi:MAG: LLM class flavin-dependent oxidoreductase [Actinomycetota bacterium]|nr:LLM class flavin-dependent oxidoreductase [Actinomycetota bacterium]